MSLLNQTVNERRLHRHTETYTQWHTKIQTHTHTRTYRYTYINCFKPHLHQQHINTTSQMCSISNAQICLLLQQCYYFDSGRSTEYCDKYVCLLVHSRNSKTTRLIFTKFLMHVVCGHDSVISRWHCDMLYTSRFCGWCVFLAWGQWEKNQAWCYISNFLNVPAPIWHQTTSVWLSSSESGTEGKVGYLWLPCCSFIKTVAFDDRQPLVLNHLTRRKLNMFKLNEVRWDMWYLPSWLSGLIRWLSCNAGLAG